MEWGPDWSGVFPELLVAIAIRLPSMEDFTAFRGVCTAWRSAATKDMLKFKKSSISKIPFLMLAEKAQGGLGDRKLYGLSYEETRDGQPTVRVISKDRLLHGLAWHAAHAAGGSEDRQLYSLSRNTVWTTMSFPWFKNKRCMDVGFGWVLTVAPQSSEVNLVNPFTGATVDIPDFTTFPEYRPNTCNRPIMLAVPSRGILSADPSRTSEFVFLVLTPASGMAYWRPGGTKWMMVDYPLPKVLYSNIGCYKGRMFDIDYRGNVRMRDPSAAADFTKSDFIVKLNLRDDLLMFKRPYFVESSSGELLLIFRSNVESSQYGENQFQTEFKVVRVDVVKGEYEMMEGIGKDAVFLGDNVAVCVDANDFPCVVKPNHVYFTDDCYELYFRPSIDPTRNNKGGGGRDMGIYNFEDGSIERFPVGESLSYYCPPLWIFPPF